MQRPCDQCGKLYEAKRSTSKFCGSSCRVRHGQGVKSTPAVMVPRPPDAGLVQVTERQLQGVSRLDTVLGQQALVLANRITHETAGSSVAALSKELRAVMVEALDGVAVAVDPLDELRLQRDRRRASAG